MKNRKRASIQIVVAIMGIMGVILGVWLYQTGFFTSADVRFIRQYSTDDVCPISINTYSGDFEISFSNDNGNRGADLFVTLTSPNNISFIKEEDSINIPAGKSEIPLNLIIDVSSLKINRNKLIENATILINASYESDIWGNVNTLSTSCVYKNRNNQLLLG